MEWEAFHEAGLDLYKWYTGEYSADFREYVIAWYGLHNLVRAHQDDAALEKSTSK